MSREARAADVRDLTLAELTRFWPRDLRRRACALGVSRVGALLDLSPLDVVAAPTGSRDVLASLMFEIDDVGEHDPAAMAALERFRERPGLTRALPPPRLSPRASWGCLYAIWRPRGDTPRVSDQALCELATSLESLYRAEGLSVTHATPRPPSGTEHVLAIGPGANTLARDVVVIALDRGDLYSVQRRRWASAAPGRDPLALALSTQTPVVAIRSAAGRYTEAAVYLAGRLTQISVRGERPPRHPTAAELDLDWLCWLAHHADGRVRVPVDLVAGRLGDAEALATLLGFRARGYTRALRAARRR